MLEKIPLEMRSFPQWICYRQEHRGGDKLTKVPYCPHFGKMASSTNPATWTTFEQAKSIFEVSGVYHGIGFVFCDNDPFFVIDLDEAETPEQVLLHEKIAAEFKTYSEISPSGKGLHIIGKGSVPCGRNSREHKVEIYSNQRFITMTGNVWNDVPIVMQQSLVSNLWEHIGQNRNSTVTVVDGSAPQIADDLTIYNRAASAENGAKFVELWNGNWPAFYPSQSEADFALVNIIAFYTQNRDQVTRLFHTSAPGQREKAKRSSYLHHPTYGIITKAFDRQLPPVNLDAINQSLAAFKSSLVHNPIIEYKKVEPLYSEPIKIEKKVREAPKGWQDSTIAKPPGLLGDIAEFMLNAAVRPVPEIAVAGAIGLMAGICGRAYNTSSTGLNHYILVVAKSGRGKDAIQKGMSIIFDTFANRFPQVLDFLGPRDFSSGQGLVRHLSDHPTKSFVSVMGEFGIRLKEISRPNAFGPDLSFLKIL